MILRELATSLLVTFFCNGYIDSGWDEFDEEKKLFKRGVELINGRAAMLGILGLMVHEQLGGSVPIVGEL